MQGAGSDDPLWRWVRGLGAEARIYGLQESDAAPPQGWQTHKLLQGEDHLDPRVGKALAKLLHVDPPGDLTTEHFVAQGKEQLLKSWISYSELAAARRSADRTIQDDTRGEALCRGLHTKHNCDTFGAPECQWSRNLFYMSECRWVRPDEHPADPRAEGGAGEIVRTAATATAAAGVLMPWLTTLTALGSAVWGARQYTQMEKRWQTQLTRSPKKVVDDLWMMYVLTGKEGHEPLCMARKSKPGLHIDKPEVRARFVKMLEKVHAAIKESVVGGSEGAVADTFGEFRRHLVYAKNSQRAAGTNMETDTGWVRAVRDQLS